MDWTCTRRRLGITCATCRRALDRRRARLNIIGVPQDKTAPMTGSDGPTIFVQLFGGDTASSPPARTSTRSAGRTRSSSSLRRLVRAFRSSTERHGRERRNVPAPCRRVDHMDRVGARPRQAWRLREHDDVRDGHGNRSHHRRRDSGSRLLSRHAVHLAEQEREVPERVARPALHHDRRSTRRPTPPSPRAWA